MSITEITRRVRWEAAHYLPNFEGKCRRIHGHSWSAEIVLCGDVQTSGTDEGMILDMGNVARYFEQHIEPILDHQLLNETMPIAYQPPSTENVARYLSDTYMIAGFPVARVTVRETENQTATHIATSFGLA